MPYQHTEVVRPKGINKDLSPYELPPEVWSNGRNVSFKRYRTSRIEGYENQFTQLTSTIVEPEFHIYFADAETPFWAYASWAAIYKTDGTDVGTTLMGDGYLASEFATWTGCNYNGLIILNNHNDIPQVLDPVGKTDMIDLPNWGVKAEDTPPDSGEYVWRWGPESRAEVIRPYKNYLMAMDCYDDTLQRFPNMIRWSSPAESGDVPPSWDPFSLSEQAGLYALADTPGRIVEGMTLGDYFCIYKTDCVWLAQFIGGEFVFSFRKLFGDEAGCLDKECVAEFDGKHFVLSSTGAYVHNGHTKEEIMDPWVKDELFGGLNTETDTNLNVKTVADHDAKEIWVYYGEGGVGDANKALIWSWESQEWTIRDLTGISHIAEGYVQNAQFGVDDWESDVQEWDLDPSPWGQSEGVNPLTRNLLFADPTALAFYAGGTLDQLGEPLVGWVERIGIDFNDDQNFKYLSRITPHIVGSVQPLTIKVFAEDFPTGTPQLIETLAFDPNEANWVDCHVVGRHLGIRFEGEGNWILSGYTLEWEPTGNF